MKKILLLVSAFFLASCATKSSGVVPTGQNAYLISISQKGSSTGSLVKANAFKEANRFCEKQGMRMESITATSKDPIPFKSHAQAEITFRCVAGNNSL